MESQQAGEEPHENWFDQLQQAVQLDAITRTQPFMTIPPSQLTQADLGINQIIPTHSDSTQSISTKNFGNQPVIFSQLDPAQSNPIQSVHTQSIYTQSIYPQTTPIQTISNQSRFSQMPSNAATQYTDQLTQNFSSVGSLQQSQHIHSQIQPGTDIQKDKFYTQPYHA